MLHCVGASHDSSVYYSFPLSTVRYHRVRLFLSTYWPHEKMDQLGYVRLSYWSDVSYWWSRGGSNPWPPHCECGRLLGQRAFQMLQYGPENWPHIGIWKMEQ